MIEIFELECKDINRVAELSFMVGKMHDEALPKYFNKTGKNEHLRIIKNMLSDENAQILVAKEKDDVVGFACLYVKENKQKGYKVKKIGYVYNLGVDAKVRKKGVGKLLMSKAEEFFLKKKCDVVDLNVFIFNSGALEFYKNLGYEIIDVNLRKVLK